jgi:hypothetical protein
MTQDFFVSSGSFISLVSVITLTILSQSRRGKKHILITDYRRGVRFVGGVFSGVLEPGSYSFDARKEQITIMDMRPQPILMERLTFQDALKQQGVVSLATEFVVRDPQRAATALRDQVKDCYLLARNAIRTVMSQQIIANVSDLAAANEVITKAVRTELLEVGMDISNTEVTELWLNPASVQNQVETISTVVQ